MLWVDKHRPTALDKLDYHRDLATQLSRLAAAGDLPHMLFYGPSGAGKKTRIMALLRAIFGAGVERLKLEHRAFKLPTGRTVEMSTVASTYHIEINPGDAGIYDRYVVQELIKEMAQYNAMSATGDASRAWKVLILSEVDRLTKEAQAALRRTMEKYTATCRLILVANNLSKVIEPVRSRCLGIRVAAPTQPEMMAVLAGVAAKEGLALPQPVAAKIAAVSGRNMRRAILMLEAAKAQSTGPLTVTTPIPLMDWERFVLLLGDEVLAEQSPRQLLTCRARVYELLVNCIPADIIMKRLSGALMDKAGKSLGDAFRHEVTHWAAYYEHRLQLGSKELFHIEAFIAKVMTVIKTLATAGSGGATGSAAAGGSGR